MKSLKRVKDLWTFAPEGPVEECWTVEELIRATESTDLRGRPYFNNLRHCMSQVLTEKRAEHLNKECWKCNCCRRHQVNKPRPVTWNRTIYHPDHNTDAAPWQTLRMPASTYLIDSTYQSNIDWSSEDRRSDLEMTIPRGPDTSTTSTTSTTATNMPPPAPQLYRSVGEYLPSPARRPRFSVINSEENLGRRIQRNVAQDAVESLRNLSRAVARQGNSGH